MSSIVTAKTDIRQTILDEGEPMLMAHAGDRLLVEQDTGDGFLIVKNLHTDMVFKVTRDEITG